MLKADRNVAQLRTRLLEFGVDKLENSSDPFLDIEDPSTL